MLRRHIHSLWGPWPRVLTLKIRTILILLYFYVVSIAYCLELIHFQPLLIWPLWLYRGYGIMIWFWLGDWYPEYEPQTPHLSHNPISEPTPEYSSNDDHNNPIDSWVFSVIYQKSIRYFYPKEMDYVDNNRRLLCKFVLLLTMRFIIECLTPSDQYVQLNPSSEDIKHPLIRVEVQWVVPNHQDIFGPTW